MIFTKTNTTMKKVLLTMLLCVAATLTAMADWQPSDNDLKQVAAPSVQELCNPKILVTDDGKTVCVYRKSANNDPDTGEAYAESRFLLYFQVYDANGNTMLPGEGVCVSKQPTESALYGQTSAVLASNGDILISNTDIRYFDDKTQQYMPKIYLYRYTLAGQPVWSADGVELPDLRHEQATLSHRFYKLSQVTVSGDNIYLAANYEETDKKTERHYYFEIACLDQNGNILSSNIQESITICFEISPAPEGSVYVLLPQQIDHRIFGLKGMRMGADLQNMWANEVTVEKENLAIIESDMIGTIPDIENVTVTTHTDGSLLMMYDVRIPPANPPYLRYNRLQPDGTVFEESIQVGDTLANEGTFTWVIEDDAITFFEGREYAYKYIDMCHLRMNRIKIDGTLLWEKGGRSVMLSEDRVYEIIGATTKNGNYYVLYFAGNPAPHSSFVQPNGQCYVEAYDADGNLLWNRPVLNGVAVYSNDVAYVDNMMKVLFMENDPQGTGGTWLAYIDLADDSHANVPTGLLPGEFSINDNGGKVAFSQGNLQYRLVTNTYRFANAQNIVLNDLNTFVQYDKNGYEFIDLLPYADDWGTQPIQNLGNKTDSWRLLSADEWKYILEERPNADQKKALASLEVDDDITERTPECGIVLLPDNFVMPVGLSLNCNAQNYYVNYFTKEDWAQMEANGAVFLTANGALSSSQGVHVSGLLDNDRNMHGYYWTTTTYYDQDKKQTFDLHLLFSDETGTITTPSQSASVPLDGVGEAVRLVKDVTPTGINSVKAGDANHTKTVKRLENGRIVIDSNGNTYNIAGQKIKQ